MMPKLARDKSALLDEIFEENYPAMKRWANMVAKNDRPLSEDLVHDVFIKCRNSSSDLSDVENIKSFLFTAIKNTYVSQLRRKTSRREVSISEELPHGSPVMISDPRISNRVRDQLLDICFYACRRKDRSLSASVMLLRYFHGYHTAEIKKIVKRSQNSVEARMSKGRAEVANYLAGIERMAQNGKLPRDQTQCQRPGIAGDGFITEIRSMIFKHAEGRCLRAEEWRKLYLKSNEIGREDVSHLVSCVVCLETINELLKLPLLSQRHPFDSCHPSSAHDFLDHARASAFVKA